MRKDTIFPRAGQAGKQVREMESRRPIRTLLERRRKPIIFFFQHFMVHFFIKIVSCVPFFNVAEYGKITSDGPLILWTERAMRREFFILTFFFLSGGGGPGRPGLAELRNRERNPEHLRPRRLHLVRDERRRRPLEHPRQHPYQFHHSGRSFRIFRESHCRGFTRRGMGHLYGFGRAGELL